MNPAPLLKATARLGAGLAVAGLTLAVAGAQTTNANSASFNAGYNRAAGQENRPIDVSMGDGNGNVTVVGGQIQTTSASSVFAHADGAMDLVSGVGGGTSSSASSGNLNVVVQGGGETLIVSTTQTGDGHVTVTTSGNP